MKKIVVLLLVVVGGVYLVGTINLSEARTFRFLNELETLSLQGKGDEYCEKLHDDLTVSIQDLSTDPPVNFEGGRDEFCDYASKASAGMRLLQTNMQVTRDDYTVTRSWLHPWTARVSYTESRTIHMTLAKLKLRSEGEDAITLVQTFGGVKMLKLESESWLVD